MKEILEANHEALLQIKNLYSELRTQMLLEQKNNLRDIVLFKAIISELHSEFPDLKDRIALQIDKTILAHADDQNQCDAFKEALAIAKS